MSPHEGSTSSIASIDNHKDFLFDATASDHLEEAINRHVETSENAINQVIRKVDYRLLPALGALYAFALVDRVNLGNARIAGMAKDLDLDKGDRYSLLTFLFFVPYVITELPANIGLRKIGSTNWLGFIGLAWGAVTLGMGFVNSWGGLLACRMLLGAFEGGILPGSLYLLSCWYTRYEIQKRFSLFYVLGLLASGFGGVLAYGFSRMDGLGGLQGWRWIFVMEGIITVLVALYVYYTVPEFPDKAMRRGCLSKGAFLDQKEMELIMQRIEQDRGDASFEKPTVSMIFTYMRDWKVWIIGVLCMLNTLPNYAFAYFLPAILFYELKFPLLEAQCLFMPPYVFGVVWMLASGWLSDTLHVRGPLLAFNAVITIIGLAVTGYLANPISKYIGLFFAVAASQSNVTTIMTYMHNNIIGQAKKAFASSILVLGGALGGIIAGNIFRQEDAPEYRPALVGLMISQALTIFIIAVSSLAFARLNHLASMGDIVIEGKPGFRYTY